MMFDWIRSLARVAGLAPDAPHAAPVTAPLPPPSQVLADGAVIGCRVAAGTTLVVESGRLRVSWPPRWVADQMMASTHTSTSGQALSLDEAGWYRLSADEATRFRLCR